MLLWQYPHVEALGIKLETIEKETLLFEGPASEAVKAFPANVNVAATISLAGIGFERTKVRVIADPTLSRNVHVIYRNNIQGFTLVDFSQ